jgi:hypothetical protein
MWAGYDRQTYSAEVVRQREVHKSLVLLAAGDEWEWALAQFQRINDTPAKIADAWTKLASALHQLPNCPPALKASEQVYAAAVDKACVAARAYARLETSATLEAYQAAVDVADFEYQKWAADWQTYGTWKSGSSR